MKRTNTKPVVLKSLVYVKWLDKKAVYLNGRLVFFGEGWTNWTLLNALGFDVRQAFEVPYIYSGGGDSNRSSPPEFTTDSKSKIWIPPNNFAVIESQYAAYKTRDLRERITGLKNELAGLEDELAGLETEDAKP